MMMKIKSHWNMKVAWTLMLGLISGTFAPSMVWAESQLKNLQVEYANNPLDVETSHPRFNWQMTSDDYNVMQQAYRIVVKKVDGVIVWDSGKVKAADSLGILFESETLQPEQSYQWELTVWDNHGNELKGKANFSTAWFDHSIQSWEGAKWIGANQLPLQADYFPVFRIQSRFMLDKQSRSKSIGFVFGANDPRLMDANRNLNGMENKIDESYVKVVVDTAGLDREEQVSLNIYRVGYTKQDRADKPLFQFTIPNEVINKDNRYQQHDIDIVSVFGALDIHLDDDSYRIPKPERQSPFVIPSVNINPMGYGPDYIAYPMLSDVGFALDTGQLATIESFKISNYRAPANALRDENYQQNTAYNGIFSSMLSHGVSITNHGLALNGRQDGLLITVDPSRNSMPMVRHEFTLNKKVKNARLYMTARGIYQAWANGTRVSDGYLNPGLTQYDKTQRYQVMDVTENLHQGNNALAIQLGEGWWSGNQTFVGMAWNYFGDRTSVLAKLKVEYEDGTQDTIVSDPETWKIFTQGPLRYASLYQGEIYDATVEKLVAGWTRSGFDDSQWQKAEEIDPQGTTYPDSTTFYFGDLKLMGWPKFEPFEKTKFYSQGNDRVVINQHIQAKSVQEVRPSVFVYDMGQNMAGIPQVIIRDGNSGQRIRMRYAEMTYPDLPDFKDRVGMVMIENIRGALAQDIYVLKGGKETISPRYTYHGFRYIELTGVDKALPISDVQALSLSSVAKLDSSLTTSREKVNNLWNNITWSMRSNFLSIPTDTPARNERMGWSGDINVFVQTANFLANKPNFLRHHLQAMRDTQSVEGQFADVAPIGGGFGGLLWGSAGITVAWESWRQFNDLSMLQEHYPAMQKYIDYIDKKGTQQAGLLGDWLSPEDAVMGPSPSNYLLWDAYYAYDLRLMAKMAKALGDIEQANLYSEDYEKLKDSINSGYLDAHNKITQDPNTKKPIDTMASYAVLLGMDLVDEESRDWMSARLAEKVSEPTVDSEGVQRPAYSLMTGFIGTAWISKALSENGYSDLAYKLLLNDQYPSWLYSVDQGATTIWERLNSFTKDKGFSGNNSMNSFNHYAFGSVGSWMYQHILGIQRDPETNGYQQFILAPEPDWNGDMRDAKGYYDSLYGRIESRWLLEGDRLIYQTQIPANTHAILFLPADQHTAVLKNGKTLKSALLDWKDGKVRLELGSGRYVFKTKIKSLVENAKN
jgi:alpha-L-rhamnosidase